MLWLVAYPDATGTPPTIMLKGTQVSGNGFNIYAQYETVAVTPTQFAEALGVHKATVLRWIKAGHVQATRVARCWLIPVTEFDRLGLPRPAVKDEGSK